MAALTPTVLMDLESRMRVEVDEGYNALNSDPWWTNFAKVRTTEARRDLVFWLLATATIKDANSYAELDYDELVSMYMEITHKFANEGMRLRRDQLEDLDGGGFHLAAEWSRQIGAQMQYWPQLKVWEFLQNGESALLSAGYDGKALFATDHPYNPMDTGLGSFANLFTGSASGAYPGALPIDESVTLDEAIANIATLRAYIAGIKMPNGRDPRYLRIDKVWCSPKLYPRACQVFGAEFIAGDTAGGNGGTNDVKSYVKSLGFGVPGQIDEMAGFESDTTYFCTFKNAASSNLGSIIYTERTPFEVSYYGPMNDATLSRMQQFEWAVRGRNGVSSGHPYLIAKVKGS